MKLLLVALNAQYIHTNLAVRSIAAYAHTHGGIRPAIAEFTINQPEDFILQRLYAQEADAYFFSCYIWNITQVRRLAASLRKLYPAALLFAGGPQVGYNAAAFLAANPAFNAVVAGEGEAACLGVFRTLETGGDYSACPGVATGGRQNPPPAPLELDSLPFPYEGDLPSFTGRILYYESMRGCPHSCSYCLSSLEKGVRFKSLQKVYDELSTILSAAPKQVKFVDRSFNASPAHALAIWRYLAEHDNGVTNFHFEIQGESLLPEHIQFLSNLRPGLFQFEVGVQTTNLETLREIRRPDGLATLFNHVAALQKAGNIHLHLDLIAGLPFEEYESFMRSFNEVYAARPQQLQLGFLKVLSGSAMEANAARYGLVYSDEAPFEILYNRWLSFKDLLRLKGVAAMVEAYYNSGRFRHLVARLEGNFPSPFAFYDRLAAHFAREGGKDAPPGKLGYYNLLGSFAAAHSIPTDETLQWLCRYDMALHEKIHALPGWVTVDGSRPYRARVLAFYAEGANRETYLPAYSGMEAKQLLKQAHVEVFPFHPQTLQAGETAILFDYSRRDITGRALTAVVELPAGS